MGKASQKLLGANKEAFGKNDIKTKDDKAIAKNYTDEEMRTLVKKYISSPCDPDYILKNAIEQLNVRNDKDKKVVEKADKELKENSEAIAMSIGLETHYPLAETVNERFRPHILEVVRQIENEYGCKTSSEKALAEIVANAYFRVIDSSRRLNNELGDGGKTINEDRTKYLVMLSKQTDRANRQFLSALFALKQFKVPVIEMNIVAKTAFISQNQQINAVNNLKTDKDENINPK